MPAGFHDAVVAAPSQAAALRAWGTTTDLFAAGRAFVVEDDGLRAEALAKPGEVVKRSRGDEAAMLGPGPATAEGAPDRPATKRKTPRLPPPPDRSKLDAAEHALSDAERDLTAEAASFERERADLDRREQEARAAGQERRVSLENAVRKAQAAFARGQARR